MASVTQTTLYRAINGQTLGWLSVGFGANGQYMEGPVAPTRDAARAAFMAAAAESMVPGWRATPTPSDVIADRENMPTEGTRITVTGPDGFFVSGVVSKSGFGGVEITEDGHRFPCCALSLLIPVWTVGVAS
jgi:hypothetical protein